MRRVSVRNQPLRIALAALVSLAVAPAARADDSLIVPLDPTALTTAAVSPVVAASVDPAALVAAVTGTVPLPLPESPPQAVPAAAVEPTPALEPQPTPIGPPPPPQPADPTSVSGPVAPDPEPSSIEELPPPPAPQPAVAVQQYQPESPQYQPSKPPPTPEGPPPAPAEPAAEGLSLVWGWNCGDVAAFAPTGKVFPASADWNAGGSCTAPMLFSPNNALQNGVQYHNVIPRYHAVNVNVSIHSVGDEALMLPNVAVAVEATSLVDAALGVADSTADVLTPLLLPSGAPRPDPGTPPAPDAAPAKAKPPGAASSSSAAGLPAPATTFSPWTPRHATPRHVRIKPEVHRSRPSHRRPTRHPLPPSRGPVIPVSSAGAAPLGGADGGGFHLTLLLAPFALALVDSARRVARDAAPPVVRERDKRRERPG